MPFYYFWQLFYPKGLGIQTKRQKIMIPRPWKSLDTKTPPLFGYRDPSVVPCLLLLLDMCVAVGIGIGRVTSSGWFMEYRVRGLTGLAFVPRDVHRGPVGPIPDPMGPTEVIPPLHMQINY